MRRSVTEVIRRGFENTAANWPLILIRIGETVLVITILFVTAILAIVPMLASAGLSGFNPNDAHGDADLLLGLLTEHWVIIVYIVALITLVLVVFIAIHSFIEAGSARIYVDAERATAGIAMPARSQFRTFTGQRWFEGARQWWWPVFLIYNIAWSVAMILILIPVLVVGAIVIALLVNEANAPAAGIGCLGVIAIVLFTIAVSLVTNVWCQKAIVVTVARGANASAALRLSWRQFVDDAGRHIAIALIVFVIIMAGSSVFSSFSFMSGLHDSVTYSIAIMPLQIIGSILNSIFSAAVTSFFMACLAVLTLDNPR